MRALAEDGWAGTGNGHAPYGFQNPSNIMRSPLDDHYYALISTWGTTALHGIAAPQVAGNCLIRTADLNAGPGAWRAWGGAAFNISLNANPYTADGAAHPQAHVCVPVTHTNEYLSLLYSTYYKQYMTVTPSPADTLQASARDNSLLTRANLHCRTLPVVQCTAVEQVFGDGDCSTVSFKLSPDLINWSESTVIRKCICEGGKWEIYPSLMDPRSLSNSFDTVGKTALLFHVNLHGRQIWSYEVEFGGADEEQ